MTANAAPVRSASRVPARSIVLPVEHGAWGFLFEPSLAGAILAPSAAAPFILIMIVGAFLSRQPLKFLLSDLIQKRQLPRTAIAQKFVIIFGSITVAGLIGSLLLASTNSFIPFLAVAPLVVYLIALDVSRKTRGLLPELLAALALASSIAVLALADGFTGIFAVGLWAIMLARLIPAVMYVRSRLRLEKGKEYSALATITAHIFALAAVVGFFYLGISSLLTILMTVFLLGRATFGLSRFRRPASARSIGISEVIYGVIYALTIVFGYYFQV